MGWSWKERKHRFQYLVRIVTYCLGDLWDIIYRQFAKCKASFASSLCKSIHGDPMQLVIRRWARWVNFHRKLNGAICCWLGAMDY